MEVGRQEQFTIRLLGPIDVRLGTERLPPLRTHKGEWLLALLALRAGRAVAREWLAGVLWPESVDSSALYNLRRCLSDLRRALGTEAERLTSPTSRSVALDLSGADLDVTHFDDAVKAGEAGDITALEEAVRLYRGPLLEGCDEAWAAQERAPREESYLMALERLAEAAMATGDMNLAVAHLRRAVVREPSRESAQRALMTALARSGDYASLLHTYRQLRSYLWDRLNTEPAPETQALFRQLQKQGRSASTATALPLIVRDPRPIPSYSPAEPMPLPSPQARQIVLLYRRDTEPDGHVLRTLKTALTAQGHQVFYDRYLAVGLSWAAEIEREIRNADIVIPLLSAASAQSETLEHEVEMAQEAAERQGGRPLLLPVRIQGGDAQFGARLARLLASLQVAEWHSPGDDEKLASEMLVAVTRPAPLPPSATNPFPSLESVGGAVPLASPFYVERQTDIAFQQALLRGDSIVLVKGPRQVGKTSLLSRGLQVARQTGARVVATDFQKLTAQHLESTDSLFMALARHLADRLELDTPPERVWDTHAGPNENMERYLRRYVLGRSAPVGSNGVSLVWGLDEVDRLFSHAFGSEVFALFRSWHNERALDPDGPWSRLTLAIAYATEAHLFITDLNQSPFNVGTRLILDDFTEAQVADLAQRHGDPLRSDPGALRRLYALVGGHPYLIRQSLHQIASGVSLDALEVTAPRDEAGPFSDHLRRLLFLLVRDPELGGAVREVVAGRPCPAGEPFYRLRSAGVIIGDAPETARPRCGLYAAYLGRHLG